MIKIVFRIKNNFNQNKKFFHLIIKTNRLYQKIKILLKKIKKDQFKNLQENILNLCTPDLILNNKYIKIKIIIIYIKVNNNKGFKLKEIM